MQNFAAMYDMIFMNVCELYKSHFFCLTGSLIILWDNPDLLWCSSPCLLKYNDGRQSWELVMQKYSGNSDSLEYQPKFEKTCHGRDNSWGL